MEKIKLDLVPSGKMPSLHASQYDDGREHGIDLFENGVVYKLDGTETLTINERKGDDCICSLDIENTFADSNHIVFASTEQMCAVWGNNICELVIAKGEKTIGTLNFILEIEPSPTEGGIESESEIKNLERQIEEITEQVIGDDYYTAEETDEAIATATEGKADTTYVNTELAKKADKTDTYTKTQVDNALNNKMDKANPTGTGSLSLNRSPNTTVGAHSTTLGYYNIASGKNSTAIGDNAKAYGESSTAVGAYVIANGICQFVFGAGNIPDNNNKFIEIVGNGFIFTPSNARTLDWQGNETLMGDLTYNGDKSLTSEISRLDGRIDNLPKPVIFKGTLGVGGTVTELPVASESVEGWEFKCITEGTYAGLALKVGDTVTCFNPPNTSVYEWEKTGSQDTDTDTWRAIKINGVEKLGNGISSGAVDFKNTANVQFGFNEDDNSISATLDGIYTESEVDNLLDDKADADNTYTKAQVDDIVYNILPDDTASGSVANFNTSLALPIKSLDVDVNAVQESGTPTPATPLPISGWSEISLAQRGTNLWDEVWELGAIDNQTGQNANNPNYCRSKNYIQVPKGENLYLVNGNSDTLGLRFYDSNKAFIGARAFLTSKVMPYGTYDLPTGTAYIRIVNTSTNVYANNISLNYPSTDTTYHAYNGNTEVINLGGTYYGGHFTQDKAGHRQFEVTHALTTVSEMDSNRSWYYSTSNAFWINEGLANTIVKTASGSDVTTAISDYFETVSRNNLKNADDRLCVNTSGYVCIYGSELPTTKNEFLSSVGNAKLVYPLATPYTIDLPDGEPINTLNGTNNIFADTGDTEVVFKSSVNDYVSAHSGGNLLGMGGVYLGGAKSGGSEEEPDEGEDTEKVKLDETKVEVKEIGDDSNIKKLGGE